MEHEINILVVEPGRPPRPARVDYSLETFSQLVGGELAMGCFLPHRVMLLYNEDANRQGLPPNRCNPFVNECISGTFLLCGLSDEEGFCSLSPARQAEFQRLFASPGEFMMLGAENSACRAGEREQKPSPSESPHIRNVPLMHSFTKGLQRFGGSP